MTEQGYLRAEFVTFLPCILPESPTWDLGPVALENLPGTPYEIKANQAGRRRYVPGEQIPLILWGATGEPRRWSLKLDHTSHFTTARGIDVRLRVTAVEILRVHTGDGVNAIAAIHGECTSAPESLLSALIELSNVDRVHGLDVRALFTELIAPARLGASVRRGRMMTLVQPREGGLPEIAPNLEGRWRREHQWLWFLATCHLPGSITVGESQIARLQDECMPISDEWTAFSAVEGTAYVARTPDAVDAEIRDLLRQRSFRFHTIETDAFLLGEAQDLLVTSIANRIFAARRRDVANPLSQMRSALAAFRMMYWGERMAERGFTNELLSSRRRVKEIPERLRELQADVDQVTNEVAETASASTNSALGVLAVVGLPLSSALTVWEATGQSLAGLWWVAGATIFSAAVLVSCIPGLRSLPRLLMRRQTPR